jgi:hypothetical protein
MFRHFFHKLVCSLRGGKTPNIFFRHAFQIRKFQTKVIPSVVQSDVSWMRSDPDSTDFLIVPVDRAGNLDLDCLRQVTQPPRKAPEGKFVFRVNKFFESLGIGFCPKSSSNK